MIESGIPNDTSIRTDPIRVMIVEDHANLRELLGMYCRMQDDMVLCAEAASAEQALEMLDRMEGEPPSVGLIDLSLPGMSGIELIAELRIRVPDMTCLILSGHKGKELSEQALEAGAQGYMLKGKPDEIAEGVRRAVAGELVLSPELDYS